MEQNTEQNIEQTTERKLMLSVHEQNGTYYIQTNKDSNVPEIAFEVAVIIRCLLKDGFIKNVDEFVDFVKKYATDPQYGEVN